jgi:dephospho-CoA kinase
MMNLIVGVVGEICCGKTTVCEFFRDKYGFTIVDSNDEVTVFNTG